MPRFGFGKKDRDAEEDTNRLGLFGSRSKSKSPAPPSSNPYAAASAPADPYAQGQGRGGAPPPQSYQNQNSSFSSGGNQNGHGINQQSSGGYQGASAKGGYADNRYGNTGGYGGGGNGANPYGGSNAGGGGSARPGGYGGLGRSNTYNQEDDGQKDQLFGGARDRYQTNQQQRDDPPDYTSNAGGYDPDEARSYGAYGDRQLTAEEEEEEDVLATKNEIRHMKQETWNSAQRSAQMGLEMERITQETAARLRAQGEMIDSSEIKVDVASGKMDIAGSQTRELQKINGSMFNPANYSMKTKGGRDRQIEKAVARTEKAQRLREETRQRQFNEGKKIDDMFKSKSNGKNGNPEEAMRKQKLSERAKYNFEEDSEDERLEQGIDDSVEQMMRSVQNVKITSKIMGSMIDAQNRQLDRVGEKSDQVQDGVTREHEKLKRIR